MRDHDELPEGVQRTFREGTWRGYRVNVWVPWPGYPQGRRLTKRFPTTATIAQMIAWREDQRVDARRRELAGTPLPPVVVGFAEDAERYLGAVQTMPQFEQRRYHLKLWVDLFGERETRSIASHEIRAQRDRWRLRGPKWILEDGQRVLKPFPLSAQEVNLRLRALENMWTVLWPNDPNIVRDVPECVDDREPQARGQSFALAREVLKHMPDTTTPTKGGAAEVGSLSRIRFEVMLLTGLTHKQIGMLKETDVDYSIPSVIAPRRLKGRVSRRARPHKTRQARQLLPTAVPVLQKFFAMGANRPFSRSSFWRTVKRAVRAANVERAALGLPLLDETLRPYDWTRHTFGTEVYRTANNLKTVQELLGHSDINQSAIYAQSAVREQTAAVLAELDKRARLAPPAIPRARRPQGGTVGGTVSPPRTTPFDRSPRLVKRPKP
jgi:integrase